MEKITLVRMFRQLLVSSIDKLGAGGMKPEAVYREFIARKANILENVHATTNRKEHLALMLIANKVYVNPTKKGSSELLKKEFEMCLNKLPSVVNGFKK